MRDEQAGTPDWGEEVAGPLAELGEPVATFRTSPVQAALKWGAGGLLVGAGVVLNYLYWWVLGMPILPDKCVFLVLFGLPVLGAALMASAYRDRGLWVLVYPQGVLRWQRGEVVSFPWPDVQKLTLRVTRAGELERTVGPGGETLSAWLPLEADVFGSTLELRRNDGVEGQFPAGLGEFGRLARLLQEETFRRQWPRAWEDFRAGRPVSFGGLTVGLQGLRSGTELLPWQDLKEVKVAGGKLTITGKSRWRTFSETPVAEVPNPHVLLALVEAGRPVMALPEEEEDEGAEEPA